MRRVLRSAVVMASSLLLCARVQATPVFEMEVRSGTYNSGTIIGTIAPNGMSGAVTAAGLNVSGGGGNSFTVGALSGTFNLVPDITIDLSGNLITHISNNSGSIRVFLTLAGLSIPQADFLLTDQFSGTLAATQSGTRSLNRIHIGSIPFSTQIKLFDTGQIPSANMDPGCSLQTGASFFCDLTSTAVTVPQDPFSLTSMIMLTFGGGGTTFDKSENFDQRLTAHVPEPSSLALFGSFILAAGVGFGRRRAKRRRSV